MTNLLRGLVKMLMVVAVMAAAPGHVAMGDGHRAMTSMMACCPGAARPVAVQTPTSNRAAGTANDVADHACCVIGAVLPDRLAADRPTLLTEPVAYWRAGSKLDNLGSEPERQPPGRSDESPHALRASVILRPATGRHRGRTFGVMS